MSPPPSDSADGHLTRHSWLSCAQTCGRICHLGSIHSRPRRQRVRPCANAARDFAGLDAPGQQRVRNQRTVAAPRDGLCAHQHDTLPLRELNALVQTLSERRGLHVVGIAAEAGIPPSCVGGVAPGTPQAAQSRQVPVVNPSAVESRRQLVSIELRIVSRPRDRAHVDDSLDAVRFQKMDEVLYRPCRVTDREDDARCHLSSRP